MNQRVAEKDTATWKIWNVGFQCTVKKIDLLSAEEIQQRGTFTYGNKQQDLDMINERILTYRTPNDMIELHRKGIGIRLPKRKDGLVIYELIQTHLLMWINYLKWSGLYNAPYDDLIAMDEFAGDIHGLTKFDLDRSMDKSLFNERVNALTSFSRQRLNAVQAVKGKVLTDEELEKLYPRRDTLSYLIQRYRAEGGVY